MSDGGGGRTRLVHFSDVHITARPLGWRRADWFNKRFPGWVNYRWLGRGRRFRFADEVLTVLMGELHRQPPDRVIFSGDATALGFEAEFVRAAALMGVGKPGGLPGLAVPGNHDYYTRGSAAAGLFEKYFAPWQEGQRVQGERYPFAQRAGPAWLVGVNSCTGNRWFWDAAGSVDGPQLERLGRLLGQLSPGPRILVTHYPVCLSGGSREKRTHGLRNVADVVRVAREGGVCLWLHGHRHHGYHLFETNAAPFPVICAGSATQNGVWSYLEYVIEGRHFHARQRVFAPAEHRFQEGQSFETKLAG